MCYDCQSTSPRFDPGCQPWYTAHPCYKCMCGSWCLLGTYLCESDVKPSHPCISHRHKVAPFKILWLSFRILYNYCTVPSAISVIEVQYKLVLHEVPCYNYYIIWLLDHCHLKVKKKCTKSEYRLKIEWARQFSRTLAHIYIKTIADKYHYPYPLEWLISCLSVLKFLKFLKSDKY